MLFNIKKNIIQSTCYVSEDVFTCAATFNMQKACDIGLLLPCISPCMNLQRLKKMTCKFHDTFEQTAVACKSCNYLNGRWPPLSFLSADKTFFFGINFIQLLQANMKDTKYLKTCHASSQPLLSYIFCVHHSHLHHLCCNISVGNYSFWFVALVVLQVSSS